MSIKPSEVTPEPCFQLKGKSMLNLADWAPEEVEYVLNHAIEMKKGKESPFYSRYENALGGQTLGMIFEKPSTRTRVSFEVGMFQLGGQAIYLNTNDIQLGRGESIEDTAQVLSRYVDAVMIRTHAHETLTRFDQYANIPVINGLCDLYHPTQVLADLLTIKEHKGKLQGLRIAYIGDGKNNMAHTLLLGATMMGMDMTVASPDDDLPQADIYEKAKEMATQSGAQLHLTTDPHAATKGVDVVITDVWTSMGQEDEQEARMKRLEPYQVNTDLCSHAATDYIFLHCLPAHRGEEVTADIIDGGHSVVFDEAENRLHAQKALLYAVMSR
ncbi:ornithine carbamoyltransferase [Caldalkalibacillus salinus]|uniref:ornithine carbamoyltransferase n=1 Tax=Caldalkalibacillus salinus TaxID=2803787 RepID=UPI0019219ED6|nr:ornithine carbamoyltransferase [Caldalkalibacillus salinus]